MVRFSFKLNSYYFWGWLCGIIVYVEDFIKSRILVDGIFKVLMCSKSKKLSLVLLDIMLILNIVYVLRL